MKSRLKISSLCLWLAITTTYAQAPTQGDVIVDQNGVMRWETTHKEVKGFGVNYSVPFAHAYRSAQRMNVDVKQAIDQEVYHFKRLGFDLYRLHVWDTEISDTLGNLIENEHLDTFDYLLKTLKDHEINYVITPIAFWGNGWPEPDTESPGFSHKYGKGECLTNPDAIAAQQNYLYQFLNHVNPYTGLAYKNDPNVIAFEVSNEPHHREAASEVTQFVKGMVQAMRKTGTKKPIFYNMSHAVQYVDDYFKGGVQGGTFQWYPTGLGYGKELSGNLLPNVNEYQMPFDSLFKKHHGAKLVYEFDAADVGRSYIYPAMARSFRSAGIQIATHFAYDPTYLAPYNTEYNTHYMNLNYTPQKALSLKICAEVFHEVPLNADYGTYPQNNTFGNFSINYSKDLAEYNAKDKFFYTNNTTTVPKNESQLKEIAGYGNSALVTYNGTGAYFLDKIASGVWRLEVLPDALWVNNPFGRNSLDKVVGVTQWNTRNMTLRLDDLGVDFDLKGINDGNQFVSEVDGQQFQIRPGTYILTRQGVQSSWSKTQKFKTHALNAFYAPPSNVDQTWLIHQPIMSAEADSELEIKVACISEAPIKELVLTGYNSQGDYFNKVFTSMGAFQYKTTISADHMKLGFINYNILVSFEDGHQMTYPSGLKGGLYDWDFYDRTPYKVSVRSTEFSVYLFDAIEDADRLVRPWRRNFKLVPTQRSHEAEYQMNLDPITKLDPENSEAALIHDYSFKHFVVDKLKGYKTALDTKNTLVFRGHALNNKPCKLQIALVMKDGSAYGKILEVGTELKDYVLNLGDLKPVKTVTLPRPYPSFLPYYLEHDLEDTFNIHAIESVQLSIGPGISPEELQEAHGIGMINLRLE